MHAHAFNKHKPQSTALCSCHGKYIAVASKPFSEYHRQTGDRIGHNWMIPNVRGKRAIRHALFDTNYWKSFIHARLAVAMGDKGCFSLFQCNPILHQLFAEHLTSEYRVMTEGRGRKVEEWKLRPEASDNHWLDGIVGCAVAASMLGAKLPSTGESDKPIKQRRNIELSKAHQKLYLFGERKILNPSAGNRKNLT